MLVGTEAGRERMMSSLMAEVERVEAVVLRQVVGDTMILKQIGWRMLNESELPSVVEEDTAAEEVVSASAVLSSETVHQELQAPRRSVERMSALATAAPRRIRPRRPAQAPPIIIQLSIRM
mmetsp:Transcript_35714/g.65546  ORF Transcript_35714/g.65546 Transcript_35714/m.65546 type:complete len:121 (-) Transcript_35714:190-552(-)